jgi:hypothetical protein
MKAIGLQFGSLTILPTPQALATRRRVLCRCVCGAIVEVSETNLRSKSGAKCGCAKREKQRVTHTIHGLNATPEHRIWGGMKNRCENPNNRSFPEYGERGISVCERWMKFENFLADMGPRQSPRHSVERLDNERHYEPNNCRWATPQKQGNNKRNNRILEHCGRSMTLAMWAREMRLSPDTLERRLNLLKWPVEKALETPARGWGPGHPRSKNQA